MTEDELRAAIRSRIRRAVRAAETCPPMLWARLYAEALDDIAELIDPTPVVDIPPPGV